MFWSTEHVRPLTSDSRFGQSAIHRHSLCVDFFKIDSVASVCLYLFNNVRYTDILLRLLTSDTNNCVPIQPPTNGAIACDNWEGGEFCQAQCQQGTTMRGGTLGQLHVCLDSGDWSPEPKLLPCKGIAMLQYNESNLAVSSDSNTFHNFRSKTFRPLTD